MGVYADDVDEFATATDEDGDSER